MQAGHVAVEMLIYTAIAVCAFGVGFYLRSSLRSRQARDEGPLVWFPDQLTMSAELGRTVRSLTFHGANASTRTVRLKHAHIISAIDGTSMPLEIKPRQGEKFASGEAGVHPGSAITLVARFNGALGLELREFAGTWRQFSVNVEDDARRYELAFNEAHLKIFFTGAPRAELMRRSLAENG